MKRSSFRKVNFTLSRTHMYGHYELEATYRGRVVKTITTDSEAWDYLDDDEHPAKMNDARRSCYYKIVAAYQNSI